MRGTSEKKKILFLSYGVLPAWFNMLGINSIKIILSLHFRNDISSLKLSTSNLFSLESEKVRTACNFQLMNSFILSYDFMRD